MKLITIKTYLSIMKISIKENLIPDYFENLKHS